ncbi:unnamed protein product [Closterium sp. Naga37s-1]|nr:unnamed protein product [Closterium sp. Naga37s-1]
MVSNVTDTLILEERIVKRTEQLQHNNEVLRREMEALLSAGSTCSDASRTWSSRTSQQSLVLERIVAELHESRTEAESANHLKSRFLASMSRENRTPMNGVLVRTTCVRQHGSHAPHYLTPPQHGLGMATHKSLDLPRPSPPTHFALFSSTRGDEGATGEVVTGG